MEFFKHISRTFREPGFGRRLTFSFGAVVLVVVMSMPVAMWGFFQIVKSADEAAYSAATVAQVGQVRAAIGALRVDARDYAANPNNKTKNALASRVATLTSELQCIEKQRTCIGKESNESAQNAMSMSEIKSWKQLGSITSNAHVEFLKDVNQGNTKRAIRNFDNTISQQVVDRANQLALQAETRGYDARQKIRDTVKKSALFLLGMLATALLLAMVLAALIPRSLLRRLDVLRNAAHEIAGGNLMARVDPAEADVPDEISDLIRDFNRMASFLEDRHKENETLAGQLHLKVLNEQERATRDPLTGLRNHRFFQDALAAELDRTRRSGSEVSIAMLDLDNFKQVNDRFGHHEGDAVLLRVTQGISANLRPYDLACRLGGEEFGIIFPDTDAAGAELVLGRIAEAIRNYGPNAERCTFSAGVATFPLHADNQQDLSQRADESAYAAKANGKAQTIIYDPRIVVAMDSDERQMQRSREAVINTATTLASAVDQKDPYSRRHSEFTALYAATIARALGLDEDNVKLVYRAGLLHDVGKIGVPDEILHKPGRLTDDEYAQIKMHPEFGHRILSTAGIEPISTWTRHHHEHWDGSGYPLGLRGEQIPLGSRILLVADAFEAMTSDRVYRKALGLTHTLQELKSGSGKQFDPHIASVMIKLVQAGIFDQVFTDAGKPTWKQTVHALSHPQNDPNQDQQPPQAPPQAA